MLQALQQEGLVVKARYGSYYVTAGVVMLASGFRGEPKLVQAAKPVADALTREIRWPVAVGVPDQGELVVRYATTSLSPLTFFHAPVGMRLSLVSHAMGRAYLAHCTATERSLLLHLVGSASREIDLLAGDAQAVSTTLREVRRKGFALRYTGLRPESSTIAVPVLESRRAIGALGLTWFTSVMKPGVAEQKFLPALKDAAREVSRRLKHQE